MSTDTRIGFSGLIVALFGIAAFYLWPDKRWIGWTSLAVSGFLLVIWVVMEIVGVLKSRTIEFPIIEYNFCYEGRQAFMSVTNRGKISEVWASLCVDGATRNPVADSFARWAHSASYKTKIAKGETRRVLLASLKIGEGLAVSNWIIHYATENNVGMTEATYSSVLGNRDDGQAPDIHLYVRLFSDPDSVKMPKPCHVILHSNAAELGD